jgi:hypothetical protein
MLDEHAVGVEGRQQATADEVIPARGEAAIDLPKDDPVPSEDEARRVSIRAGVAPRGRFVQCFGPISAAGGLAVTVVAAGLAGRSPRRMVPTIRAICWRRRKGTALAVAMAAWTIRLPEPASM